MPGAAELPDAQGTGIQTCGENFAAPRPRPWALAFFRFLCIFRRSRGSMNHRTHKG